MPPAFPALAGWEDAFHEILSYLRPSEYFVFDDEDEVATRFFLRRTLLSLAVSCRAFFDPALDMLWHSLDNIHPLLKLLPNYQCLDSIYYLEGDIPPEAWSRLKTYAARVRGITFSRKANIDAGVWWTILEQCQGIPLLPNLRKLHTIKLNAIHIFVLRAFASPSLRDVFLEFYEDLDGDRSPSSMAPIAGSALQEFSIKATEITRLCLYPDLTIGREDLMCLSRFTQLEELYLNDHLVLDEDLLFMLNGLKNIRFLKIPILLRGPPESTQVHLPYEFHNLTGLDLCGPPAHLARFIVASSMPRLNDLSIWFGPHHSDGIETYLTSICRHIGPHTLAHFTAQLSSFVHAPQLLMRLLEPLLPFAQLEEVVVRQADSLPLRDEDLARISHAWPKLRMLRFDQSTTALEDPDRQPGSTARSTLAGLVDLARGCPHLTELCIPELDASVLPPIAGVPLMGHGPLDLCIENLVGAEDEETQLDVAVILDRLFPCLDLDYGIKEQRNYGGNANPYTAESENVSKLLRVMQLGREHYPRGVEPLGRLASA
ncbi:hypothetical protein GSI_04868 [Ganoderma sinense ZZ0214-1]|uniref:F-box domain-containing protein n=1 Tax=Ganoderma sinense ZZ0214-1 TaxID=1077348 RepID=A0A2G8SG71_9APHY|nr:hypothetical protein GSI_04868 [Ganoderma sinense ZZ0214-1]